MNVSGQSCKLRCWYSLSSKLFAWCLYVSTFPTCPQPYPVSLYAPSHKILLSGKALTDLFSEVPRKDIVLYDSWMGVRVKAKGSLHRANPIGVLSPIVGIHFWKGTHSLVNGVGVTHTILLVTEDGPASWPCLIQPTEKEIA